MDTELKPTINEPETTQAVLGPNSQPNLKYYPAGTQRQYQISHRDFYILSLHLAGYTAEEISELTNKSPASIYATLRKKEVILVRQQLLEGLEDEFEALQKQVIQVVRDKLKSQDERVQLEAVGIWMKAHGKYQVKREEAEITGEDVVNKILNQQISVQVNVDAK